jgi:hypothetical protein
VIYVVVKSWHDNNGKYFILYKWLFAFRPLQSALWQLWVCLAYLVCKKNKICYPLQMTLCILSFVFCIMTIWVCLAYRVCKENKIFYPLQMTLCILSFVVCIMTMWVCLAYLVPHKYFILYKWLFAFHSWQHALWQYECAWHI